MGTMRLTPSQLLFGLNLIGVIGSWLSIGYVLDAGLRAMDCSDLNFSFGQCSFVQAGGFANFYLVPSILVPIING